MDILRLLRPPIANFIAIFSQIQFNLEPKFSAIYVFAVQDSWTRNNSNCLGNICKILMAGMIPPTDDKCLLSSVFWGPLLKD